MKQKKIDFSFTVINSHNNLSCRFVACESVIELFQCLTQSVVSALPALQLLLYLLTFNYKIIPRAAALNRLITYELTKQIIDTLKFHYFTGI